MSFETTFDVLSAIAFAIMLLHIEILDCNRCSQIKLYRTSEINCARKNISAIEVLLLHVVINPQSPMSDYIQLLITDLFGISIKIDVEPP